MYDNILEPNQIEVGKQYFVDEAYHWCANVTILENECGREGEDWVGWKIRIDEEFGGMTPMRKGAKFSVGWNTKYSHYNKVRIRPLGSMPEYTGFKGEKDWRNHLPQWKEDTN